MWSDVSFVAGLEVLAASKDHQTYASRMRRSVRRDTPSVKQSKEQSSCNKMHNVLASYLSHKTRVHSRLANRSVCPATLLSLLPCNDDPELHSTPFPRCASQSMWHTRPSLRPALKKIYNTHPPLSVIHSSCELKEKVEWWSFFI